MKTFVCVHVCVYAHMRNTLDARSMHARCTLVARFDARIQITQFFEYCDKIEEMIAFLSFYVLHGICGFASCFVSVHRCVS